MTDRTITQEERLDRLTTILSERLVRPEQLIDEQNDAALAVPLLLERIADTPGFDSSSLEATLTTHLRWIENVASAISDGYTYQEQSNELMEGIQERMDVMNGLLGDISATWGDISSSLTTIASCVCPPE